MRRQTIERMLPAGYQRAATPHSVLSALLEVMDGLHAPAEEIIAGFDTQFAPYSARPDFLPFLAHWVTLDHVVGVPRPGGTHPLLLPPARVRDLIAEAAALAQVRGTPGGLSRFLEIATGVSGFAITEPPQRPFHFVVQVPPAARGYAGVIGHIVAHEKPAATTFELQFLEDR